MANQHDNLTALFTDIADSIRAKTGSTEPVIADNFPEAIGAIETCPGGPTVETCTFTAVHPSLGSSPVTLYYIDGDLQFQMASDELGPQGSITIDVLKGSIILMTGYPIEPDNTISGVVGYGYMYAYRIMGNTTFET